MSVFRLYFFSIKSDKRYFLQTLQLAMIRPTSFMNLWMHEDVEYETFKATFVAQDLFESDDE